MNPPALRPPGGPARLAAALTLLLAGPLAGAETTEAIVATFELDPAFEIELVAREPIVFDPVDMDFDESGRLYVLEMGGYPFPPEGEPLPGRIVRLADADGDGVYDDRRLFAEGFLCADSILPWRGGLLVASPPDLLYLRDENGDGLAERREVLLTGFRVGNTQHNFNGLTYGLDNWIYAANGGNGGLVQWPGAPEPAVSLRGQDFRIDPLGRRLEFIGQSSGGFEIALDAFGRLFSTHNLHHVHHLVFPGSYLARNALIRGSALAEINDHREAGGLSRIYAIGPQETRVNHPEQSGFFSGACGITFYGGGAFPEGYNGNLFVCDVVLNLVHRDVLRAEGSSFVASRGEARREFLASTDRAFRPVNLTVGPDGALYVIDMHRPVIEHPEWIPDEIEADLDINAGRDQGRIFRIRPREGLPAWAAGLPLTRQNLRGVVGALAHPNKWWRDTAQRLLIEWRDPAATPLLRELLAPDQPPLGRLHALWTLEGLGSLREGELLTLLDDPVAGIRENVVIIAETRAAGSPAVAEAILARATDPDARVRLQTALALGSLARSEASARGGPGRGLLTIALGDRADPWTRLAVLTSVGEHPLIFAEAFSAALKEEADDRLTAILVPLAEMIGERAQPAEVGGLMAVALPVQGEPTAAGLEALEGLARGLSRSGDKASAIAETPAVRRNLDRLDGATSAAAQAVAWSLTAALNQRPTAAQERALERARRAALDSELPVQERLAQLALLEHAPYPDREAALWALLDIRQPQALQEAAVEQLARVGTPDIGRRLLEVWKGLGPRTRRAAGDILLYQRGNHELLLAALENGELMLGQLNLDLERRRTLLRWSSPEIGRRAARLFGDAEIQTRAAAIERMRPALTLTGDPMAGRELYGNLCAKCHIVGDEGKEVGPNLTDIFRKSAETLLHEIIDPNAAVDTHYIGYTIVTQDGRILNGLLLEEGESGVTLREAEKGDTVIPRAAIKEMYAGGLSLMPEELDADLSHQQMADLLAFLLTPR